MTKRVLVVEDEYFLADELEQTFKAAGAEVFGPVPTVAEARRLIESQKVDAATLNINLRDGPSFPLADVLIERRIPFAFLSGYEKAMVPIRFHDSPQFVKPIDIRKVVSTVLAFA